MRLLLVALLLASCACTGDCSGVGAVGSMRAGDMQHGAARGGMTPPVDGDDAPAVVYFDATFSPTNSDRPECTDAVDCVLQCWPVGTAWTCVNGAGASVAVTQGTGATTETTPYDYETLTDVTAAKAPSLASAVAATLASVWSGEHTVILQGFRTPLTSASLSYFFSHESANAGLGIRQEGGTYRCLWSYPSSAVSHVSSGTWQNGWSQSTCRKSGLGAASSYGSISDGLVATPTANSNDPGAPSGVSLWFGRRTATDYPLRGGLASVTIYDAAKSNAFVQSQQARWNSLVVDGVELTWTGAPDASSHARSRSLVDEDGYQVQVNGSQPRVSAKGLYIEQAHTNAWAADPLAVATWTDVGTPTVTSNVASGPFSRTLATAEVDRIVDDDGAAFEGKQSTGSSGTAAGFHTSSCILAEGDEGVTRDKVRLVVATDGTGSTTCDLDLQDDCRAEVLAGWYRCECTATVGGTPTYVRGQVLVGAAAADTGSLLIAQCQVEADGFASSPKVTNAARGDERVNIPAAEVATWWGGDIATGGSVEIVFQVDKDDADRQGLATDDAQYLFDVNSGVGHAILPYRLPSSSGGCVADKWCVQMANSGCSAADYTSLSDDVVALASDTWYALRVDWRPTSPTLQRVRIYFDECADPAACAATTLVGDNADKCQPDEAYNIANLGRRYNNTATLDGHIYRVTVGG